MPTFSGLTIFEVKTENSNEAVNSLYANGRMQVAVLVHIRAIDEQSQTYTLSQEQLDAIKLTDRANPNQPLSGEWTFTQKENKFAHQMPGNCAEVQNGDPEYHDTNRKKFQSMWFWVSATQAEPRHIAASITIDETTINTADSAFNSYVTLQAIDKIVYDYDKDI
ncbi:hypothetical protein BDW74DRAFT_177894 [Aspergillus multicolor]|uniref:uncharacterized protein n=1 Tax=Aspergillus multicolor TaxID=41759 RepID=UPI003CCDC080